MRRSWRFRFFFRALRAAARVLTTVFLASALVSCITDPITGRSQFVGWGSSEGDINALGAAAYQQTLQEAAVSQNPEYTAMVLRVGQRIAPIVDAAMRELGRETFQWEFKVIESPQVNAWCLPGGKVAFYTGIMPICQNEAGVAVVMGHEIAHAYAQHGRSRMARDYATKVGLGVATATLGGAEGSASKDAALQALGLGAQLGGLKFSRGDESHADELGLIFMSRAGYDPREAPEFWKRMSAASGGQAPPEFLSTHPSHDTRIQELEAQLPRAIAEYEASAKP